MIKRLFFLSFMMAAIGVPYAMSSSADWWNSFKSRFRASGEPTQTNASTNGPDTPRPAFGDAYAPAGSPVAGFPQPPAKPKDIEGLPVHDLAEVLHFGPTPAWVMSRWPRVSTGLAQPDLQGYRVPLVTGTGDDDLAGSLTYYFDGGQTLQYITFHGATGNPHKLVTLVTQRYGFKPEESQDPSLSLFLVKWNGKPVSELRIRTARVLRADQPRARYHVDLALKRP